MADGNIAAGSTDAVNGGQLSGVKSSLEQQITQVSNQAGDAVKNVVKYDVDTNGNRLNSVSLIGGDTNAAVVLKNVAAGTDDTDAVNVKQLKGVQSSLNQLGALAVQYDDSSKSSITLGGAGGTRITNVQAGTLSATSTDAVNGSQLYATNQQVAKNTTDITNLQGNVTNIANGKAGLVQQQDPNGAITVGKDTGGTSVNFSGTSGDRVLTGVAAGVKDNDAVNMGQFNNALKNVAANDQIRAAATDANTTWIARADAGAIGATATATGKNAVAVGAVADRDNSFSVGAKGSERQVTNVAAGTAPTDAVNVQQLNDNLSAASNQAKGYTDQRIGVQLVQRPEEGHVRRRGIGNGRGRPAATDGRGPLDGLGGDVELSRPAGFRRRVLVRDGKQPLGRQGVGDGQHAFGLRRGGGRGLPVLTSSVQYRLTGVPGSGRDVRHWRKSVARVGLSPSGHRR